MPDAPVITVRPGYSFGRPSIGGVTTSAVAGMVMAGESVQTVAYEYDLTPVEVLWACWHEAMNGCYRRQWSTWANRPDVYAALRQGEVPDPPPDRDELGTPARRRRPSPER